MTLYHLAIGGASHHSTLETKAVDYESEANLRYIRKILYQQQANKQLQVDIFIDVGSFYKIDALRLRVVVMYIYIEHRHIHSDH